MAAPNATPDCAQKAGLKQKIVPVGKPVGKLSNFESRPCLTSDLATDVSIGRPTDRVGCPAGVGLGVAPDHLRQPTDWKETLPGP